MIRRKLGFFPLPFGRRVHPKRLANAIIACARKNALFWGDNRRPDVPNSFIVEINPVDWKKYYLPYRDSISRNLVYLVETKIRDLGFNTHGSPQISLTVNNALDEGEYEIQPFFTETAAGRGAVFSSSMQAQSKCNNTHGNKQASDETTDSRTLSESISGFNNNASHQPTPECSTVTPTLDTQSGRPTLLMEGRAYLFNPDGTLLATVSPDCTIGVLRRSEEDGPAISLDHEAYEYVSQIHGIFLFERPEWHFRNLGENRTVIEFEGNSIELCPNQETLLNEGSIITLAHGTPIVFGLRKDVNA